MCPHKLCISARHLLYVCAAYYAYATWRRTQYQNIWLSRQRFLTRKISQIYKTAPRLNDITKCHKNVHKAADLENETRIKIKINKQ